MFGSWRIGSMAGIPVKVHVTLLLLLPWLINRYATRLDGHWAAGALITLGLFGSVALHELGHALAARRFGVRTRDILLTPLGGVASLENMPRQPRAEIVIALAGPAVSLVLALLAWGGLQVTEAMRWRDGVWIAFSLTLINASLLIFNLLPCFPMDGGRVLRAALIRRFGRLEATRRAVKLGTWLAIGLAIWGLYSGQWLTVAIAWFVHAAARAEYRAVLIQEMPPQPSPLEMLFRMGGMGGMPSPPPPSSPRPPAEIIVGPPPYRR